MHNINQHPGPRELIQAINTDIFDFEKYCPLDFGQGVATRKK